MRTLKFRAWSPTMNKMIPWEAVQFMSADLLLQTTVGNIPMQYVGLKDKNGKEIYEGDIIRSKETDEVLKIGEMTPLSRHLDMLAENIGYYDGKKYHLRSAGGQYHLDDWVSWPEMYEVIGNIYENPELNK